jgi:AAA domain
VRPPLADGDIERIVGSAYQNGQRPPGVANAANEFGPVADLPELREWERMRAGTVAPSTIKATPYEPCDPASIPPREWIYGRHYIRKFVSGTVAPGGVGKSSLFLIEALSIVTGMALLTPYPIERGRVWWWNGEDPREELKRRIEAARLHYGIAAEDIRGRLFVDSGRSMPIVIATDTRDGARINAPDVAAVKATIRENGIDVMSIDPFVSCHRVSENDNNKIEAVASAWARIADECNCSIELVHHTRKTGGAEATAEDARGASAFGAAARSIRVLNAMTDAEMADAGVDNRRLFFRVDDGKANMAPPAAGATWYRLHGVDLGNATGKRPADNVAVVVPWTWVDLVDRLPADALATAQAAIAGGEWRADVRSKDWAGYPIAAALELDASSKEGRKRIARLLDKWTAEGGFIVAEGMDKNRQAREFLRPAPVAKI